MGHPVLLAMIDVEQQRGLRRPPAIDGRLSGLGAPRDGLDREGGQAAFEQDVLSGLENGFLACRIALRSDRGAPVFHLFFHHHAALRFFHRHSMLSY
ncbi:hypothetical protein D3C72_1733890 [compost metagenome]